LGFRGASGLIIDPQLQGIATWQCWPADVDDVDGSW